MWRQLKQVALNYLTRPTPGEWVILVVTLSIFMSICTSLLVAGSDHHAQRPQDGTPSESASFALLLAGVGGASVARTLMNQLRWQFYHPRASLTPNFQGPHLLVFTVALGVPCLVVPLIISATTSISVWCALFVIAFIVACVLQTSIVNYIWPIALPFLMVYADRISWPGSGLWLQGEGYRAYVLFAITLACWAMVVQQVFRDCSRVEDSPGYELPLLAREARADAAAASKRRRGQPARSTAKTPESKWVVRRLDRRIRRAPSLSLAPKLRIGFAEPTSPMSWFAFSPLLFVLVMSFQRDWTTWTWDPDRLSGATFFPAMVAMFCALGPASQLAAHLPLMPVERLLPVTAQDHVDALLKNAAWRAFGWWVVLQAGVACYVFLPPWQGFESPSIAAIAVYLTLSFAGWLYAFSVGLFVAPMTGCFPMAFAVITGFLASLGLLGYWATLRPEDSSALAVFLSLPLALAGAGFLHRARQVWRHKELGAISAAAPWKPDP